MKATIRGLTTVSAAVLLALMVAAPAWGAAGDPLFVFTPGKTSQPPPAGSFEGPCGLAVDSTGRFYVSDYYHHAVDVYSPSATYAMTPQDGSTGYLGQIAGEDPLDGPCGLALDATNRLYVNNFHRNVVRFGASPLFGAGTVIDRRRRRFHPPDRDRRRPGDRHALRRSAHLHRRLRFERSPADERRRTAADRSRPLADYYGLAFANGDLYVANAATETVELYNSDPALDITNPVATIDGQGTPSGGFISLRDSALAVDRATGELYVADDLQPAYTEQPQATIYVFGFSGLYRGHLKYNVIDARAPGLAVDNSTTVNQGRVYVTSGNSSQSSVYAYPPGAVTNAAPRPPIGFSTAAPGAAATAAPAPAAISSSTEETQVSVSPAALAGPPALQMAEGPVLRHRARHDRRRNRTHRHHSGATGDIR